MQAPSRGSWQAPDKGGFPVWIRNRFVRRISPIRRRFLIRATVNGHWTPFDTTREINSWNNGKDSICEQTNTLSSIVDFYFRRCEDVDLDVVCLLLHASIIENKIDEYIHCEEYILRKGFTRISNKYCLVINSFSNMDKIEMSWNIGRVRRRMVYMKYIIRDEESIVLKRESVK